MKGARYWRHVGVVEDDFFTAQSHFRSLYDDLYDDVWVYCRRRCESFEEAQDIVAEIFAVVWRRLDDVPRDLAQARGWVFGVARNALRNRRRSRLRRRSLDRLLATEAGVTGMAESIETEVESRANIALVVAAMKTIGARDRELLRAVAWEDWSYQEIAEDLGCSVNAVAIRVHRARQRLTAAVQREQRIARATDSPNSERSSRQRTGKAQRTSPSRVSAGEEAGT